ncbi:hypothetical protein S83_031411, partial [Arachis hypogaea]
KLCQLDLEEILCGENTRTTLMIKSIPNKYASKMLFAAIDENHHGTYDLMYLPIDFKNKCNVGYAFINMVSPSHMIPFYEGFSECFSLTIQENFLSSNLNVLVNQMGLTQ